MSTRSHRTTAIGHTRRHVRHRPLTRIAVGVNGFPEGDDAVALAEFVARATGGDLLLVAVHADPLVVAARGHELDRARSGQPLDHDRNVEAAAAELHLHRNSIRYRIARFHHLTGLDPRKTEHLVTT